MANSSFLQVEGLGATGRAQSFPATRCDRDVVVAEGCGRGPPGRGAGVPASAGPDVGQRALSDVIGFVQQLAPSLDRDSGVGLRPGSERLGTQ